jgi:hypothetical protein
VLVEQGVLTGDHHGVKNLLAAFEQTMGRAPE